MHRHVSGKHWAFVAALLSLVTAVELAWAQRRSGPDGRTTTSTSPFRWAAYYRDTASSADLEEYDLLVLDPDRHPLLAPLADRDQLLLAYVSLTEVGEGRAYFAALAREGALIEAHPHWQDAHFIDIRHQAWAALLLEQVIPGVLAAGFDGVFLDTLDDAELFERRDPKRYEGMQAAAAALVKTIRRHYPSIRVMVNRGYAVLPRIARDIDYVLGESVQGSFDPETRAYRTVSDADITWQVERLHAARERNPRLMVLTLDYWAPDDQPGVKALYDAQRSRGFHPYVATPLLDQIVREPR